MAEERSCTAKIRYNFNELSAAKLPPLWQHKADAA
jgi:hypothetical protein